MSKPSIPPGTRDFGPDTVRKRNFIFTTIRETFERYGFQPLETPAMENLETLMGKYGDEGDKLIFKILNNGLDNPAKHQQAREDFEKVMEGKNVKGITERALKYDLTIPFARYVAMNHGQLLFPFRRYQIQPVWRADRPQKGRYREFYQCDADVVGNRSLLSEVECVHLYRDVFRQLRLPEFRLHVNNRKILKGIMEVSGVGELEKKILVIIDKTDKIGIPGVTGELESLGMPGQALKRLLSFYSFKGGSDELLDFLNTELRESAAGKAGVEEMNYLLGMSKDSGVEADTIVPDITLARGLDYYTGTIFEAKAPAGVKIGSIGGGGRYDDLTGLFGVPDLPGVGISFGVDRIYDVLEELNLFPDAVQAGTKVVFFNLGEAESRLAFQLTQHLRQAGISAEIYPEPSKLDRQFKYAEKKRAEYVVVIGSREMEQGTCTVKQLSSGQQQQLSLDAFRQLAWLA